LSLISIERLCSLEAREKCDSEVESKGDKAFSRIIISLNDKANKVIAMRVESKKGRMNLRAIPCFIYWCLMYAAWQHHRQNIFMLKRI